MDLTIQYPTWTNVILWAVASLLLLRQLLIVLAAEQGRKHDLVKKLYKPNQEYQLSVLIPFLDPNDHPALLTLLHAIGEQDYPANKVMVHLVTTEDSGRDLIPQSLRPNVKVWQYPQYNPRYEHAIAWLIDRCLAAGGNGMFVFLKPTDIVKPDFFRNIVARGLDSFAIQGYVALKNMPETPIAKMLALSNRLFNRIGNAGRYHLGLSCRLLDSGWAIKQEVLEMIPFSRGMDLNNLEYTIRLNLENFRVSWAPNVVVYTDSDAHFLHHLTLSIGAFFNRLRLLVHYGPRLLTRMLTRFDLNYLELMFSIIKPPYLATLLTMVVLAAASALPALNIPGGTVFWAVTASLLFGIEVLALVVARCKGSDYAAMIFHTPLVYALSMLASPIGLIVCIRDSLARRSPSGGNYRKAQRTRFNEDMDSPASLFDDPHGNKALQRLLNRHAPQELLEMAPAEFNELVDARRKRRVPANEASMPEPISDRGEPERLSAPMRQPRETVRAVPLSNGQKQVHCVLKTLMTYNEDGDEHYQLTLEYKSIAFSTASYRILDQAFYELHAKLMSRGLTILSCGSCGYFYNPTADLPGALKNSGVCLFGKQGRDVNLSTDAVTVMSQSCSYHCPLTQRESIVRQWKDSLTLSRSK
jgi:hypothetical protein